MEDRAFEKIGRSLGKGNSEEAIKLGFLEYKKKFRPDMSTDEAMTVAREIVSQWDWE